MYSFIYITTTLASMRSSTRICNIAKKQVKKTKNEMEQRVNYVFEEFLTSFDCQSP